MKTVIALIFLSSLAFAAPKAPPKDPRISIAKDVTAKLYRGHIYVPAIAKVNILEQNDSFFLTQVTNKANKNYCFIFAVEMVDNAPEISILADHVDENDKETKNAFIQECSVAPTVDELSHFKLINNWPQQ
jgi:hypothetical protein